MTKPARRLDGAVNPEDLDAVTDLLDAVTDTDDSYRHVKRVDSVESTRHGLEVSLTVRVPTQSINQHNAND